VYWGQRPSNMERLLLSVLAIAGFSQAGYNVGVGRGDVTGPAAEIGMMGYAKQGQNTNGIHLRLFSRAFIVEDVDSGTRVVFVSVDSGMMGQLVKKGVIEKLSSLFPGVYSEENVVLSSTHTHSGPAGFMQYVLFNVPNLGFIEQTKDAMVNGIVESISRAHANMAPGKVFHNVGILEDEASINRSPTSYEANPEEEKAKYSGNLDRQMVQLSFYNDEGIALGVVNWFAVHPTSMNNTNHLISGEFTTMAGRRLRESVATMAEEEGESLNVVIAGLANTYTHYITTFEEYQKQRYEAASTIYGPFTLSAYIQQYNMLVKAMINGHQLEKGPSAPDLSDQEISFVPGVVMDNPPAGFAFGDCRVQPVDSTPGDRVSAVFVSGHLRNNLMQEDTFMTVEKLENEEWKVIARDAEWETILEWHRTNVILGESEVVLSWDIPEDVEEGLYRFGHKGYHHTIVRGNYPYEGWSNEFNVSKRFKKRLSTNEGTRVKNPWSSISSFFGLNM